MAKSVSSYDAGLYYFFGIFYGGCLPWLLLVAILTIIQPVIGIPILFQLGVWVIGALIGYLIIDFMLEFNVVDNIKNYFNPGDTTNKFILDKHDCSINPSELLGVKPVCYNSMFSNISNENNSSNSTVTLKK